MYYVVRKVGMGYEILDDSCNSKQVLDKSDIKSMVDRGMYIRGVAYIEGVLVITPVVPLYKIDRTIMARNKLLAGTHTGVSGFDLKLSGSNILALPLEEEFCHFINKHKTGDKFILVVPDGVTELDKGFLCAGFDDNEDTKVYIDLPESLKFINIDALQSDAFSGLSVIGLRFNGVVDRVYGATSFSYADYVYSSCYLGRSSFINSYEFKVRHLETGSLEWSANDTHSDNSIRIDLPATEVLCESSIRAGGNDLEVFLGKSIETIYPFSDALFQLESISTSDIMMYSRIVYIPDNCNLNKISMGNFSKYEDYTNCCSSYVVVLSDNEYNELKRKLLNNELVIDSSDPSCYVGVLTYSSESELKQLKDNLRRYIYNYRKYFSNYIAQNDIGKIVKLELKHELLPR